MDTPETQTAVTSQEGVAPPKTNKPRRTVKASDERRMGTAPAVGQKKVIGASDYDPQYDDRVKIVLDNSDEIPPTGLPIGRNGEFVILQPGLEAEVPLWVLDNLDNAVGDYPVIDPVAKQIVGYTSRPRYSYRMVRERR